MTRTEPCVVCHGTITADDAYPAEVAAAVLFLSSSASAYTTGSALVVDGGYLAV